MVNLEIIRISNSALGYIPPGLVTVFAGATAGVGLSTLCTLAKYGNAPRAYIIGRSREKAARIINQLKTINPGGTFVFLETQLALIHEVDRVCAEIGKLENHVDILCMSPGYLSLAKRRRTSEGVDASLSLQFYARQRLIYNLIPLLEVSIAPRVISILGAGYEAPLTSTQLTTLCEHQDSQNPFTFARTAITMTTLMFEELARQHPSISYIHSWPGNIGSPLFDHLLATTPDLLWYPAQIARYTMVPLYAHFLSISADEAGERTLFLATSGRYPATKVHEIEGKIEGFVDRPKTTPSAHSSVTIEGRGNGVYRTDAVGEPCKHSEVLAACREQGIGKVVFDHTLEVWGKALGAAEEVGEKLTLTSPQDGDSLDFESPAV